MITNWTDVFIVTGIGIGFFWAGFWAGYWAGIYDPLKLKGDSY